MKHLTKDINQFGRAIAARALYDQREFEFCDGDDFTSQYFVTCKYNGLPAAIKILCKASTDKFGGIPCFQIDEVVMQKVDLLKKTTHRTIILVLVDTRTREISMQLYDELFSGYIDEGVNFPVREPSSKDGPIWWNSCWKMRNIGTMSNAERDRLIVLRTKNKAAKNQKSIFDK
jgi:hypothetical protein